MQHDFTEWKVVACYWDGVSATIAKQVLELHGIRCLLTDESAGAMLPVALSGIKVLVHPLYVERAHLVLERAFSAKENEDAQQEDSSATQFPCICPLCSSKAIASNELLKRGFGDSFFAYYSTGSVRYKCEDCHHEWEEEELDDF